MGFFDFLKKKEEPDLTATNIDFTHNQLTDPLGIPEHQMDSFGMPENNPMSNPGYDSMGSVNLSTMGANSLNAQSYAHYPQPGQSGSGVEKDLQILSLKLDAIKSEVDSISQRVKNIEMIAEKEQQAQPQKPRWY